MKINFVTRNASVFKTRKIKIKHSNADLLIQHACLGVFTCFKAFSIAFDIALGSMPKNGA